jgi:hypothetical protein
MKSVYVFGISLAISVAILYLLWQQKKKIDELSKLIGSIPTPQQSNLDREFILLENQRIHKKIEDSYGHIHEQYEQVLTAVDNIPVIRPNNIYSGDDDESSNVPSYHEEDLIHINNAEHMEYNLSLDNNIIHGDSIMGVDNHSNSVKQFMSTNDKKEKSNSSKEISKDVRSENISKSIINESIQSSHTSTGNYPKIIELKNLCKERGLTISGKKDELVQRLLNSGYIF